MTNKRKGVLLTLAFATLGISALTYGSLSSEVESEQYTECPDPLKSGGDTMLEPLYYYMGLEPGTPYDEVVCDWDGFIYGPGTATNQSRTWYIRTKVNGTIHAQSSGSFPDVKTQLPNVYFHDEIGETEFDLGPNTVVFEGYVVLRPTDLDDCEESFRQEWTVTRTEDGGIL